MNLKLSGKCRATLKKEIRKTLKTKLLRIFSVLEAGLEPARTLLLTGF